MNEMLDKLRFQNINLTSRHISNIIRDNILLKLTRIRHESEFRYEKPIDKKNIRLFYNKVKGYHLHNIICYSEKGKMYHKNPLKRYLKYTSIFAIN